MDPADYEAWYQTARGKWIAGIEWKLLFNMMHPDANRTLLDVGCGTGHFSRRFAEAGLSVTGVDPNQVALAYACQQDGHIDYLQADALYLPFSSGSFDYVSAITSLCFVEPPQQALQEMWRVTRRGLLLGVLNKHSLLYWQKRHSKSYMGARWDRRATIKTWVKKLDPEPCRISVSNGVLVAGTGNFSKLIERTLGSILPFGAFIAVYIKKSSV